MASLSLGAGETIMATGLGAWSEYGLLWLLVLSVIVKGVFVMYLMGRYTAITGQGVGRRLVMLPGPRGWLLMSVVVVEVGVVVDLDIVEEEEVVDLEVEVIDLEVAVAVEEEILHLDIKGNIDLC